MKLVMYKKCHYLLWMEDYGVISLQYTRYYNIYNFQFTFGTKKLSNYDESRKWKCKPCVEHIICNQPFWTCYNMWSHDKIFKYQHLWCMTQNWKNHNITNEINEVPHKQKKFNSNFELNKNLLKIMKIHPKWLPRDCISFHSKISIFRLKHIRN
jgi:hypothetical protein